MIPFISRPRKGKKQFAVLTVRTLVTLREGRDWQGPNSGLGMLVAFWFLGSFTWVYSLYKNWLSCALRFMHLYVCYGSIPLTLSLQKLGTQRDTVSRALKRRNLLKHTGARCQSESQTTRGFVQCTWRQHGWIKNIEPSHLWACERDTLDILVHYDQQTEIVG